MAEVRFGDMFVEFDNSCDINSTGKMLDVLTLRERAYEVTADVAQRNGIR